MKSLSPLEIRALADRILVDAVGISTAHTEFDVQHIFNSPSSQEEKAFEELQSAVEKARSDIERLAKMIGNEQDQEGDK